MPENYRRRFRSAYPNEELTGARPLRRSPVYDRLKVAGVVFGASFGLEVPLWYAPRGTDPIETPSYRRSNAFPVVREECLAVRKAMGLMEGATAWLDRVLAGRIPRVGRMTLAPMLNERGTIIGDFSLVRLGDERYLVIGSGMTEVYHMRWFERVGIPDTVSIRPLGLGLTGFMIAGPRSRELLQRCTRTGVGLRLSGPSTCAR